MRREFSIQATTLALLATLVSMPAFAVGPVTPVDLFDANVATGATHRPGRVIATARPHVSRVQATDSVAHLGCVLHHKWGYSPVYVFDCDASQPVRDTLLALSQFPEFSWVEASFAGVLDASPDDLITNLWHLENTGQSIRSKNGTAGADISAPNAWDTVTGSHDVIVAVPDTGLWIGHPDLAANIWTNPDEICDNHVDDDSNGYVDDCYGWDTADHDNDTDPRNLPDTTSSGAYCAADHGTVIAGLVGATGDNGLGMVGVNWSVSLLPLKMTNDSNCAVWDSDVAEAITYAVYKGAKVSTVSWTFSSYSINLANAFSLAEDNALLLAMSAGNNGSDIDPSAGYPIDFRIDTGIVVAATDLHDKLAGFSNWGANKVDLAAPGKNVWSTGIESDSDYGWYSGTSFSGPLVAGAAALLWSHHPELSTRHVKEAILNSVDPLDNLDCAQVTSCVRTGGRLNVEQALLESDQIASRADPRLQGWTIEDNGDTGPGDMDGIAERGERVIARPILTNEGYVDSASITATLVLTHPSVTLHVAEITQDGIGPGATVTATDGFDFEVSNTCDTDLEATVSIRIDEDGTGATHELVWDMMIPCVIDDDMDGWLYPEDCDDQNDQVHPDMDERCNDIDDNCDTFVDESSAIDARVLYSDGDHDGYGIEESTSVGCNETSDWSFTALDCDDTNSAVHPNADEVCDGLDNDCDLVVDEDPSDGLTFYLDSDGDGHGDPNTTIITCSLATGVSDSPTDCDDADPKAWAGKKFTEDCEPKALACNHPGALRTLPAFLCLCLCAAAIIRRRRAVSEH